MVNNVNNNLNNSPSFTDKIGNGFKSLFSLFDGKKDQSFLGSGRKLKKVTITVEDWRKRENKMQNLGSEIWKNLVSFLGKNTIKEKIKNTQNQDVQKCLNTKEELPIPVIFSKNGLLEELFSATSNADFWSVTMGLIWLLEEKDLPADWQKMHRLQLCIYLIAILKKNEITEDDLKLIKQSPEKWSWKERKKVEFENKQLIESIDIFLLLVSDNQWENAREAVLAHEFAHLAGSAPSYFLKNGRGEYGYLGRMMEKEADLIAASLDPKFQEGLYSYFKNASMVTNIKEQRQIIPILEQAWGDNHPTFSTRQAYVSQHEFFK